MEGFRLTGPQRRKYSMSEVRSFPCGQSNNLSGVDGHGRPRFRHRPLPRDGQRRRRMVGLNKAVLGGGYAWPRLLRLQTT